MRHSFPLVLAAAFAVFLIVAFAGIGRPEAAHGDTAPADSVTVLGHGAITAVPDEATVTAGVHTQAASASGALAQNAKLMNAVVAALKGADGEKLQTQQVSLFPQTDPQGQVNAYAADNSVSGPTLDVSGRAGLYRDALKKAVDDARAKAIALGEAGGFGVGPVSSVTEQGSAPQPVFAQASLTAKPDATPVEPGTQDVTADVTVTFGIR